jgi:hypothetical protein
MTLLLLLVLAGVPPGAASSSKTLITVIFYRHRTLKDKHKLFTGISGAMQRPGRGNADGAVDAGPFSASRIAIDGAR